MAWDFAYAVDGQLLSDFCTMIRIMPDFATPPLRGRDVTIEYTHGVVPVRRFYSPSVRVLEVILRGTDDTGAIIHADGEAGHFYENRNSVLGLFETSNGSDVFLERTAPHDGDVRSRVRTSGPVGPPGDFPQKMLIPLALVDGWWEDDLETSTAVTGGADVVTVIGSGPVAPLLDFSAAATLDHQGTGDQIIIATGPTFPVTVDCAAKTVTESGGGSAVGAIGPATPWWFQLDVGANSLLASAGTVTVRHRNKY